MSVNADKLVRIIPRIISGGTAGLSFAGLVLTQSALAPAGAVLQFSSPKAVAAYFGEDTTEARMAAVYFAGYVNATHLPSKLLFARHAPAAVAAWLRGAAYGGDLIRLKAVADGGLTLAVNDTSVSVSNLDLATATSYSDVARLLQTALDAQLAGIVVVYGSQTGAWQITSPTAGAESTITYASAPLSGTDLSALLGLGAQAGAVLSPGLDAQTLSGSMTNVLGYARDWVTFSTAWEPGLQDKIALARWCAGYDTRFAYIMWDTDNAARIQGSPASAGYQIDTVLELSLIHI